MVCTLRSMQRPNTKGDLRGNVLKWVKEAVDQWCVCCACLCSSAHTLTSLCPLIRGLKDAVVGEVDHGSRRVIRNRRYTTTLRCVVLITLPRYLDAMLHARVVVSANPANWEGDSRTWEALATGALVLLDRMHTPVPHPLVDGVHAVFYDGTNKTDLLSKLRHYLDRPSLARRIGLQGYVHGLRYHRSVNRADYMLGVLRGAR